MDIIINNLTSKQADFNKDFSKKRVSDIEKIELPSELPTNLNSSISPEEAVALYLFSHSQESSGITEEYKTISTFCKKELSAFSAMMIMVLLAKNHR